MNELLNAAMKQLARAERSVKELTERNVMLALRNKLTPNKRDELGHAYDTRNALYAQVNGVTIEAAKTHYAVVNMWSEE